MGQSSPIQDHLERNRKEDRKEDQTTNMHIHTHALRLKRAERVRETGWEHVGTERV